MQTKELKIKNEVWPCIKCGEKHNPQGVCAPYSKKIGNWPCFECGHHHHPRAVCYPN